MSSFYQRYLAGEHEQVWDELYGLGYLVRRPKYYTDARAVAHETMRRVRANCELLIPRLESLGWKFGYDWARARKYRDPKSLEWLEKEISRQAPLLGEPTAASRLDAIEQINGLLPISLRAFYEVVGAVNFVGTPFKRPGWPEIETRFDPLYVAGVDYTFSADNQNTWRQYTYKKYRGIFICQDFDHKYFYSGVGPLYVKPSIKADAAILFETGALQIDDRELTLVRYLRYAFQAGGFLGFMPGYEDELQPEQDLSYLTQDLWPL